MAKLAIRGHKERGKEVIETIEMLGGKNKYHINITECNLLYTIREGDDAIIGTYPNSNISQIYTLEEFLEKFPYKIGDKVTSMEGYHGQITKMQWDECNCTIRYTFKDDEVGTNRRGYSALMLCPYIDYKQKFDIFDKDNTISSSFKTLLEEHKLEGQIIFGEGVPHKIELVLGDDFEVKVEDGKTFVVRKQPQYPKTYEECCEILNIDVSRTIGHSEDCPFYRDITCYENDLLSMLACLRRLRIYRDAYWKIAGEQMGLGKPWKPDWIQATYTCTIICRSNNIVKDAGFDAENKILAFPTEEMRDAFYENFKELIETCKEFL